MPRYGEQRKSPLSLIRHKILSLKEFYTANGGSAIDFYEYLQKNESAIKDVIVDGDTLMLMPSTKEAASELYGIALGDSLHNENSLAIADDVAWLKIEDNWWLTLWWD